MSQFISEPIEPEAGTFDARVMARGEPGLPGHFTWRGVRYAVADVIEEWKSSQREGGSGELYLRRHWYKVRTDPPAVMTLYCERQPGGRTRAAAKRRWWVYTVEGSAL